MLSELSKLKLVYMMASDCVRPDVVVNCLSRVGMPNVAVALGVLLFIVLFGCKHEDGSERMKALGEQSNPPEIFSTNQKDGMHLGKTTASDYLETWDTMLLSGDTAKLAEEHAKLLAEALSGLGEGTALGEFILGLYDRRETAIADRMFSEHKKAMFSGKNGAGTREWLLLVKDGQ